jgi:hypothetical protein
MYMIRVEQLQRGISAFADTELVPKMTGIQKWIFSAGVSAYLADAPRLIEKLKTNQVVRDLDLINESNMIDMDKIYRYLKEAAKKGPAEIDLPMIGKITLTEADLDKIYHLTTQMGVGIIERN